MDLVAFEGDREKNATDPSRLVEQYFSMEPKDTNGYDAKRIDRWFQVVARQGAQRGKCPTFRTSILGPEDGSTCLLLELLSPRLSISMLYFTIIQHTETIEHPLRASLFYHGFQ